MIGSGEITMEIKDNTATLATNDDTGRHRTPQLPYNCRTAVFWHFGVHDTNLGCDISPIEDGISRMAPNPCVSSQVPLIFNNGLSCAVRAGVQTGCTVP